MRTKVTLVLIFLNVALFFFIFYFEREWNPPVREGATHNRVLGAEAADIRFLAVKNLAGGAGSFTLVRNRDTWSLKEPLDWPANPHAATAIVHTLQLLEREASFTVADLAKNNFSLADYGLEKPKLQVELSSSEPTGQGSRPTATLQIGDLTKDGKRLYILSPDRSRVHIVNRALIDSLSIPLEQLRGDELFDVKVFEARSLSILQSTSPDPTRGGSGVRVRIRKDRDTTRWTFDSPHTARASKTAVELVITRLSALRAKSFPANAPAPSAAPSLRVAIESNNKVETLFLGEPVPASPGNRPPPAATGAAAVEYYAQLEGRNAVFTVALPPNLLADLRNAQENLREARILDFDASTVSKIELSSPQQPNLPPITLQRLEPPAGQANLAPPWQVVRAGEGTQAQQTLPADRLAVQRLLEQLSLLTARVFKSDSPTNADLEDWGFNRPLRKVTLTLPGNTPPQVLWIGTDAARSAYYARVGTPTEAGNFIYQIGAEIESELPLSVLAWRDRAVTEPLPATARISKIKLTDLASKVPLLDLALAPNGDATPAPRDPKAVAEILTALRALRAKAYVPGGFTERVAAGGDERPWRFQLETTVVLPGTAGAEQTTTSTWLLTERLGGSQQYAGSKELDVVFALEQPLVDALWNLTYGDRDPGPRLEQKR